MRTRTISYCALLGLVMAGGRAEAGFKYTTTDTFTAPSDPSNFGFHVDITAGGISSPTTGVTGTDIGLGTVFGSTDNGSITNYADGTTYNNMMAGPIQTKIVVIITTDTGAQGRISIGGGLTGVADYTTDAKDMNVSLSFDSVQMGSVTIGDTIYTLKIDSFPDSTLFKAANTDYSQATLFGQITTAAVPVPEPSSLLMGLVGTAMALGVARARRRSANA